MSLEQTGADAADADAADDGARTRRRGLLAHPWLIVSVGAAGVAVALMTVGNAQPVAAIGSMIVSLLIFRVGWFFLQAFATPAPPPPEPGKLRKVKLTYRCEICGAEVKMTAAASEDPEPPRHCLEDMTLVTPID